MIFIHKKMNTFTIKGNLVNAELKTTVEAEISIADGKIQHINTIAEQANPNLPYILPGFIDSHVHIESSMLVPSEFAKLAVVHGTVATISDPHEIANVCGIEGVDYMINNAATVNFKFNFGAPSCVPATSFETAGASINSQQVFELLQRKEIKYLSEMMNFPGVIHHDEEVLKKLEYALSLQKPIDGHAPGLTGEIAKQYITANGYFSQHANQVIISTDHECFTYEEALHKLQLGMKIIIREGSAAKNFDALIPLLHQWEDCMMFCSDDKHPDSLLLHHIDKLCARAVAYGVDVYKVIKAACINPVKHYKLDVGLLQVGEPADFILVNNLTEFSVQQTYINGKLMAENKQSFIQSSQASIINQFCSYHINESDLLFKPNSNQTHVFVIEALEGQLITNKQAYAIEQLNVTNGFVEPTIEEDVLKIAVVNRYSKQKPAVGFIKNIGLKQGAIASSVAHDSHNIVAVGTNNADLALAINAIMKQQGGLSYACNNNINCLPLPVAGLMTNHNGYEVAKQYTEMDNYVKQQLGATLQSPYMTLSFMALLVIPHLKMSDKGLFDADKFEFIYTV